jgi:hypothetical protein
MTDFPIIVNKGTVNQFIDCWSKYYNYSGNEIYFKHLNKCKIEAEDIRELFKWKNNMRLSIKKDISIETKIIPRLSILNDLKKEKDIVFKTISDAFYNVPAIWRIFLAHIIKPNTFPIFDQHVYRAMIYLQTNKIEELKNRDKAKLEKYEYEYLRFFNDISSKISDYKKYDEAMWAFGKFLKQQSQNNK